MLKKLRTLTSSEIKLSKQCIWQRISPVVFDLPFMRDTTSQMSLSLMEQNRQLSNCKEMDKMRPRLRRQLTVSHKNDREKW